MKRFRCLVLVMTMALSLLGCERAPDQVKIGVSFGVGSAVRWEQEQVFMEERAKALGVQIETRLNKTDEPKTQAEDCFEMIDDGIDVLILTPRDATKVKEILHYAKAKRVFVIGYARVPLGEKVDLYVGYDSERIGQQQGQYLVERVYDGDYILLRGDPGDNNAALLYSGASRYISENGENINIILDAAVPGWSPDEAKAMVLAAVRANGNHVDAILAPNDKIAGACAEALAELGVTDHVAITGMDAELDAVKRVAEGKQDVTLYMDLKKLAYRAVDEACHMARGETVNVNAEFNNESGEPLIASNLIAGQLITKESIDRLLIDTGHFTKEQIYGEG